MPTDKFDDKFAKLWMHLMEHREEYRQGFPTEAKLASVLGCSNTVLRPLLSFLEGQGLIEREGKTTRFAQRLLDPKYIAELYQFRLELELPRAIALASLQNQETLSSLHELHEKMAAIVESLDGANPSYENAEGFWNLDTEFHAVICRGGGSRPAAHYLQFVRRELRVLHDYPSLQPHSDLVATVNEHAAILASITSFEGSDKRRSFGKKEIEQAYLSHFEKSRNRYLGDVHKDEPLRLP